MTRLLIVDDSPLMRRLLGQLFEATGDFEVAFARNGTEALEAMRSFDPHVVTLDIHMPELDGIACLDRIMLEYPRPVVMVSAFTEAGAHETLEALDLGAVDFVAKPSGPVSLEMDTLGPLIVEKVRAAAQAKLPRTLRLAERVRFNGRQLDTSAPVKRSNLGSLPRSAGPRLRPVSGDGLVLIGTSTGGPAALDVVLSGLPASFGWPVLVAQHMPATFTGQLAARLNRLCAVQVVEVARPIPLEAGRVYIGRGDADLIVSRRGGGLMAMPVPSSVEYRWHPSMDRLVQSAMECIDPKVLLGVLLTGMGNDGAQSLARVHAEGGRTIAEAEETAVVWGMPGELVKPGGADMTLPLDQIAARISVLVS